MTGFLEWEPRRFSLRRKFMLTLRYSWGSTRTGDCTRPELSFCSLFLSPQPSLGPESQRMDDHDNSDQTGLLLIIWC